MIFWRAERHAIEVKIRRDPETETETEALGQVAGYLIAQDPARAGS